LSAIPFTVPDVPTLDGLFSGNTILTANVIAPVWNGGNAITSYSYTLDGGSIYQYLGVFGEPSYTIPGLDNGNSYTVAVRATNYRGNSQTTTSLSAIPFTVPDGPSIQSIQSQNSSLDVVVSPPAWNGGNALRTYYYTINGGQTYLALGLVGESSYSIAPLVNGTSYNVAVIVDNTAGNSIPSNTVSAIPYTTPDPPSLTELVSGNTIFTAIVIAPTDNGGNAITQYEYTLDGGLSYQYLGDFGEPSYTISGVDNGNSYTVAVRATNSGGNSQASGSLSAIPYTVPDVPLFNGLFSGNRQLTANVIAPAWNGGNAITEYEYTLDGGSTYQYLGVFGEPSYTISPLINGVSYTVAIRAINARGESATSTEITAIPYTVPNPPVFNGLFSGNTILRARVIAPIVNGGNAIVAYYYTLDGGSSYRYLGNFGELEYTISGVDNGNSYTVAIVAENAAGNSRPSGNLSAIPYTVPDVPILDGLFSGDTRFTANVIAPAWNGGNAITRYEYTLDGGFTYQYLGIFGEPSYTISGVDNGNSYTVSVRAVNYGGNSQASGNLSAIPYTVPDVPTLDTLVPGNSLFTATLTPAIGDGGNAITEYYYTLNDEPTYRYLGVFGQSSYTISGVDNGNTYTVAITAKNAAGNSLASNRLSGIPYTVPDAPTLDTLVSGNTTLGVNFTEPVWNGGNPVVDYNYSLDGGNTYTSIESVLSPYTIGELKNGTTYTVLLRAQNNAGNSQPSASLSAIPFTVPDSPFIDTLTPGVESIDVSFSAPGWNGGNAIVNYGYSINRGITYTLMDQITSPYTIIGLTNDTLYNVRIVAYNARGSSASSNNVNSRPFRIPDEPRQLRLTPGDGRITLNFVAPVFNGGNAISDYQYSINDGSYILMGQSTTTPYVVAPLENGTSYTIRLQAVNARGNSVASIPATAIPYAVPRAPILLDVIPGETIVDISFSVPTFDGGNSITDYLFSLDGSNGTFYSMNQDTNALYRVSDLDNGIPYNVSVKAVNARGQSVASNVITATPFTLPSPPILDTIEDGVGSAYVFFTASTDGGNAIVNYRYSVDGGNTFTSVSPAQTNSPILISGLSDGETYEVSLESMNARGNSVPSNIVVARPYRIPDPPTLTSLRPDIGAITLFFTPAFEGGRPITSYRYSIDNQTTFAEFQPVSTTSPYTIGNLYNGQSYTVYLEAINARGNSTVSNAITAIPYDVADPPIVAPLVPGIASINVSFSAPVWNGGNAVVEYVYSIDRGNTFVSVGAIPRTFTIPELLNGVSYSVIMIAKNARGNSAGSSIQSTIPYRVPDSPRELVLTPGIGSIAGTFLVPLSDGGNVVSNYYYSIVDGSFLLITDRQFVIPDLQDGTSYTVSVFAENARGKSVPISRQATPYRVPNPPTFQSVVPGDTYIDIYFTPPVFDGGNAIVNYQYATSENSQMYIPFDPPQITSPFRISDLVNGRTYTIWIQAINARGNSVNSNNRTTIPFTVPDTPTLTQLIAGDRVIDVYFSPPAFNGGNPISDYSYSLNGATYISMGGLITPPFRILQLYNGQEYTVSIKATNARGSSLNSSNVRLATPYTSSNPPTIRRLTPGINVIDVSFSAPTFDGGSRILDYRYRLDNGPLISIGSVVSEFTIPNLINGETYAVSMVAVNINGNSEFSSVLITTPFDVPDPPILVELVPGDTTLNLVFTPPTSNGGSAITNYRYSVNGGEPVSTNTLVSPYTIRDLSNGIVYQITMSAVNARGNSLFSNQLSMNPRTVPDRPTILSLTPGDGVIEVYFEPPVWNGGSPITAYRYILNDTVYTINTVSNIIFTIPDLINGDRYRVALIAVNAAGDSIRSTVVSATPFGIPGKPEILGYTPGDGNILLRYSDLVSDGGQPITSYRYSLNGGQFLYTALMVAGRLQIADLINGETYEIRIRSVNLAGASNPSEPFILTVFTIPPPPIIESIVPSQYSLTVNIRPPENNSGSEITGYRYTFDPAGGVYTDVSNVSFRILGLQGGVEYAVRVKSVNSAGESVDSNTFYATPYIDTYNTIPDPPTIQYIQDGSGFSIVYYMLGLDRGSAIQSIYYTITEYDGVVDTSTETPGGELTPSAGPDGRQAIYLSFVVNGLTNGIKYTVRMSAENEYGVSNDSVVAYSAPFTAPSVPVITRSLARNNEASIGYTVEDDGGRAISDVFYSVDGKPFLSNGSTPNLQLSQLLNKNTYTLRLVARNRAGLFSPVSEPFSIEPFYSAVDMPYIKRSNTANNSLSKREQFSMTVRINKGNRQFI
jgi:hypothetical protein